MTDVSDTADDSRDDETKPKRTATQILFTLMIGGAVLVAFDMFVLSFVGLRDYGIRLMHLGTLLAPLVPVGIDVFSVVGIAATYLLRGADWHVRAYAWLVFLFPAALSIAGNLAHAEARDLSRAGLAGASAPPVILALAVHLVVVTRRALDRSRAQAAALALSQPIESSQVEAPKTLSPEPVEQAVQRRPHNAASEETKKLALHMRVDGKTDPEIAEHFGLSLRTVQRWFSDFEKDVKARPRQRPAKTSDKAPEPVATVPDVTRDDAPISGSHPELVEV